MIWEKPLLGSKKMLNRKYFLVGKLPLRLSTRERRIGSIGRKRCTCSCDATICNGSLKQLLCTSQVANYAYALTCNHWILHQRGSITSIWRCSSLAQSANVFSKLDVREVYWHIRLDEESSKLTTMIIAFGWFESWRSQSASYRRYASAYWCNRSSTSLWHGESILPKRLRQSVL